MTAVKIILIILAALAAILLLLLFTDISVRIRCGEQLFVRIRFGLLYYTLLPQKKKKVKKESKEPKSEKPKPTAKKDEKSFQDKLRDMIDEHGAAGTFSLIKDALAGIISKLKVFAGHIRILPLKATLIIASETADAAYLATEYGGFCAVVYPALGALCRACHVNNIETDFHVDYTKQKSEFSCDIKLKFRLIFALTSLIGAIIEIVHLKDEFDKYDNHGKDEHK